MGNVDQLRVVKPLEADQCVAIDEVETGNLDEGVDDDAPGVDRIRGAGDEGAGDEDDQGNLDRARERLPPHEELAVHDAATGVVDPVLRQVLDERGAGAHVEEEPGDVEELRHAAPDAQRLCGREDVGRKDQVLVDDERDEEDQAEHHREEEAAERAVEADVLPGGAFLSLRVAITLGDERVERFRVAQAVAADEHERQPGGDHDGEQDGDDQRPLGRLRHRRAAVIGEGKGRPAGSPDDQFVDKVVEVGPVGELLIGGGRERGGEDVDPAATLRRAAEDRFAGLERDDERRQRGAGQVITLAHLGRAVPLDLGDEGVEAAGRAFEADGVVAGDEPDRAPEKLRDLGGAQVGAEDQDEAAALPNEGGGPRGVADRAVEDDDVGVRGVGDAGEGREAERGGQGALRVFDVHLEGRRGVDGRLRRGRGAGAVNAAGEQQEGEQERSEGGRSAWACHGWEVYAAMRERARSGCRAGARRSGARSGGGVWTTKAGS